MSQRRSAAREYAEKAPPVPSPTGLCQLHLKRTVYVLQKRTKLFVANRLSQTHYRILYGEESGGKPSASVFELLIDGFIGS